MGVLSLIHSQSASPKGDFRDDVVLAKAAAEGDERAARKIVLRLMPRVRKLAFSIAAGSSNGDDFAQNAMIEILRSLKNYKGLSSLESWTDRITIRQSVRSAQQVGRRGTIVQSRTDLDTPADTDMEKELSNRRLVERVGVIIRGLGPKFGLMLQLKIVLGHTVEEISAMTDVPANTVRERLRIGRKRLHRAIGEDPVLRAGIADEED